MMYPTYIVDNFFDNPEAIVNLANNLPFPNKGDQSPGRRTESLHKTHNDFFRWSGLRMLSSIFPGETLNFAAKASFQKIPKTLSEVDFIHQDTGPKLTAIVYLNKNDISGTSLFKLNTLFKPKTFKYVDIPTPPMKYDYFKFPEKYKGDKLKELQKEKETIRDRFDETLSVSGVYNRLCMFDGHQYHSQHPNTNKEERLTYIVFFYKIECLTAPLESMRKT